MSVILCTMIKKLKSCFQAVLKRLICTLIQKLVCPIRMLMLSSCEGLQDASCLRLPPSTSKKPWGLECLCVWERQLQPAVASQLGHSQMATAWQNPPEDGFGVCGQSIHAPWAQTHFILSVYEEQMGEKDLQKFLVLVQK